MWLHLHLQSVANTNSLLVPFPSEASCILYNFVIQDFVLSSGTLVSVINKYRTEITVKRSYLCCQPCNGHFYVKEKMQ